MSAPNPKSISTHSSPTAAESRRTANRERQVVIRKERAKAREKARKLTEFSHKLALLNTCRLATEEKDTAKSALIEEYRPYLTKTDNRLPLMSDGLYLSNAPRGCGLLVTGGYDSSKIDKVVAAHDRDKKGRKVRPKGASSKKDDEGGSIVSTGKSFQFFEEKTPRFEVKLGSDSDGYVLSEKQNELERLIEAKRDEISVMHETETARLNREFLARIEAGPIKHATAQVVENKTCYVPSTIDEKRTVTDTAPRGVIC